MRVENKKTLLLVEDEVLIAMVKQKELEKYGYNVLTVNTGEKAIAISKENHEIDLILMDIDLGRGIDGSETAEIILKDHGIPVVFLSSHTDPETVEKTEKITSYGYVVKSSIITVLDASIKMAFKLFAAKLQEMEKEKSLREERDFAKSLIETAQAIILVLDVNGRILSFNPYMTDISGYSLAEVKGKDWFSTFLPVKEQLRIQNIVKNALGNNQTKGNVNAIVTKGGRELQIEWYDKTLKDVDGNVIGLLVIGHNITERRQMEESLRDSEDLLNSIVENIPDMIFVKDAKDLRFIRINEAGEELLGYTREELIGKNDYDFFPKDEADLFTRKDREVLEAGIMIDIPEETIQTMHKSKRILHTKKIPIYDDKGITKYLLGISEDITERIQTEDELEDIFYLSPDMVVVCTTEGKFLKVNPACEKILGYTQKELLDLGWNKLVHPDDVEKTNEEVEKQLKGSSSTVNFINRYRCKDGSYKTLEWQAKFAKEGIVHATARDITDRKKLEETLRDSEELFRLSFENANIGMSIVNLDGYFIQVNNQMCKIYGYTQEELERMNVNDIAHPEDVDISPKFIQQAKSGEIDQIQFEKRFFHKQGHIVWGQVSSSLIRNFQGEPKYFISHLLDITEHKQMEEEIKHQLSEKEIILKETHHRIKNNFATIVNLLNLQSHSITNPEAQSILQDAIGRVNSMRVLYEKLLLTDDYRETSIKQYLMNLIDEIMQIFPGNADIKIEKQIDDFQLDPNRMVPVGIIVNELLTNIIKYAFQDRDSGLIVITVKETQGNITLTIHDNGRGLPEGFDIDDSGGFGLMLVMLLSQQLGGSFNIENQNGTRCILEFRI
jgi:PAS domain S-box-containing protein